MSALLSTFGIDWHLLFLQALNFGILLVALTWLLYKPVLSTLEKRRQMVAKGVEDAQLASEKLARADGVAADTVRAADTEAESIVKAARAEASSERAKMLGDAEARASQVAKDAELRALAESARVKRESEREIARLSILAAEKVLAKQHG